MYTSSIIFCILTCMHSQQACDVDEWSILLYETAGSRSYYKCKGHSQTFGAKWLHVPLWRHKCLKLVFLRRSEYVKLMREQCILFTTCINWVAGVLATSRIIWINHSLSRASSKVTHNHFIETLCVLLPSTRACITQTLAFGRIRYEHDRCWEAEFAIALPATAGNQGTADPLLE